MGTFEGHMLAAAALILYSLYHCVMMSLALLRGQRFMYAPLPPREKRGQRPWQRLPVEGIFKVFITLTGILAEWFFPPGINRLRLIDWEDPQRGFLFKDSWQHVTMYAFFLLAGVVDIVNFSCLARKAMKLQQAAEALAFFVMTLLLATHFQNKGPLEVRVHSLWMLSTCLLALALAIEAWVPDQPSIWVFKSWMGLVFTSWLIHLSVLLYVPPTGQHWRGDNADDMTFTSTFFCWHLGLMALLLAAIYGLCHLWHRHFSSWMEFRETKYQLCPSESSHEELQKLQELQNGIPLHSAVTSAEDGRGTTAPPLRRTCKLQGEAQGPGAREREFQGAAWRRAYPPLRACTRSAISDQRAGGARQAASSGLRSLSLPPTGRHRAFQLRGSHTFVAEEGKMKVSLFAIAYRRGHYWMQ
ncbi:transmembrane epididymal protein 1A-like [Ctenodactylus gundi]